MMAAPKGKQTGQVGMLQRDPKLALSSVIGVVSALVGIIQLLVIGIGGITYLSRLDSSIAATRLLVDSQQKVLTQFVNVVDTVKQAQSINAERVGKLETSLSFISTQVNRIDEKLDRIGASSQRHQ